MTSWGGQGKAASFFPREWCHLIVCSQNPVETRGRPSAYPGSPALAHLPIGEEEDACYLSLRGLRVAFSGPAHRRTASGPRVSWPGVPTADSEGRERAHNLILASVPKY